MLTQALLHPVANRLEEEGGDQHYGHQSAIAEVLEVLLDQSAQRKHKPIERGQHTDGGKRIGVTAPEDDVHVHEAVPYDGIRQGERKQHRSEEHTSELQSPCNLVCRLL